MPKLYELAGQFSNLEALLDDPSVSCEEVLQAAIGIEEELTEKAQHIALILRNIDSDITAIETEKKRLTEMQTALKNKYESLKSYLEENLKRANIKKIPGVVPVSFRKCPASVEVYNPDLLPADCVKIIREPNKQAIKELLQQNIPVEGARLVTDREYLKIG